MDVLSRLRSNSLLALVLMVAGCGGGGGGAGGSPSPSLPPVAVIAAVPQATAGTGVTLDGSGSHDSGNQTLSFAWTLTSKPSGSTATLTGSTSAKAALTPDVAGAYTVSLVVKNAQISSLVVTTTFTAAAPNVAPVANAGTNQSVILGSVVTLDGSSSSDANGDALTYLWTLAVKPIGSMAALSGSTSVKPSFTADVPGTYGVTLVVNDGKLNSVVANIAVLSETPLVGILPASKQLSIGGSPYVLTGALSIPGGMTLSIDAGVQIDGAGNAIVVEGTLAANGTIGTPIRFNNINVQPAGKVDPSLHHLISLSGVVMHQGALYAATGNAIYGSLNLQDSQFIDISSYVYLWYPLGINVIERNIFLRSGGISYGADFRTTSGPDVATSILIQNNFFQSWTTGYALENWACYGVCGVTVQNNSFMTTTSIAAELPPGYTDAHMNAPGNFWGTTDLAVVQGMIYDRTNDINSTDYIVFQPVLLTPDSLTPVPPPGL